MQRPDGAHFGHTCAATAPWSLPCACLANHYTARPHGCLPRLTALCASLLGRDGCVRTHPPAARAGGDAPGGPPVGQVGSWAARKIVYQLPAAAGAPAAASPGTPPWGYGFLPERVGAALAARQPYAKPHGSAARPTNAATPARQAAARALGGGTSADRHPPRVRFQAAVRAASPVRPGAADAGPKRPAPAAMSRAGALAAGAPAANACGRQAMAAADAAAAQRWRLAFKRAWIQEELHARQVRARMGCTASSLVALVSFRAVACTALSERRGGGGGFFLA